MGKIVGVGHGPRISPLPEAAGDYPNKPDYGNDEYLWFHHDWSFVPETTQTYVAASHAGVIEVQSNLDRHTIQEETDAPHGGQYSLRRLFPEGLSDGSSGGVWNGRGSEDMSVQLRRVYIHFFVKLEGPTWENPPGGVQKLWYNRMGFNPGAGDSQNFRFALDSDLESTIGTRDPAYGYKNMDVRYREPGGVSFGQTQIGPYEVGKWMRIEYVMEMNDIGSANGEIRLYTDGVLRTTRTGLELRDAGSPDGYFQMHYAPIWGGACDPAGSCPKLVDDWMRVGPMHVSGVLEEA